ncbi:MAG: 30S ribosomal protein S6 [Elusimicrobia bacterium RIFOXYD2_FULL_34_15]|nr:MAG: 30S ribosomal protein S6 [Elusimicrobia bacterium RIFOXYD2_FULL_34_15]
MPNYETVFILKPVLANEKVEEVLNKIKGIITSNQGTVLLADSWGKRRLAYTVKKFKEGSYYLFNFTCAGKVIGELENYYKTSDAIIKFITIKKEVASKKKTEKKEEKPAAAAATTEPVKTEQPAA